MKQLKGPILYVDDQIENLSVFKYAFINTYDIVTVNSPAAGLDLLKKHSFKVIISDQRMPDISGVEFLEQVAKIAPDIQRIILTAYTESSDIINAINKGQVYRYITKPINIQEVRNALDNAIETYDLKEYNKNLILSLQELNNSLSLYNEKLTESEEKFRNIFLSTSDALIIVNDFTIIEANPEFYKLTGYTLIDELPTCDKLFLDEDLPAILERRKLLKEGSETHPIEITLRTKKNEHIPIEINCKLVEIGGIETFMSIIRDLRHRKEAERMILKAIIETEENERKRFARDIHDGLGPLLSTIRLYVNTIISKIGNPEQIKYITEQLSEVVTESIRTAKGISNNLMPSELEQKGIDAAMRFFIEKIKDTSDIEIEYHSDNIDDGFNANVEIALYRILLELINNTIKHAEASKISIQIRLQNKLVTLLYADNGVGFDIYDALHNRPGHLGLQNIYSRINSFNGVVTLDSKPGEGFCCKITIDANQFL